MVIALKPARAAVEDSDGVRVLVDRHLPKRRSEESLAVAHWFAALAPGVELAQWYAARPRQWMIFRRRYLEELAEEVSIAELFELESLCQCSEVVTLVSAAKSLERSHAAILRDLLSGTRKPPRSTGTIRASAGGRVRVRRKA